MQYHGVSHKRREAQPRSRWGQAALCTRIAEMKRRTVFTVEELATAAGVAALVTVEGTLLSDGQALPGGSRPRTCDP